MSTESTTSGKPFTNIEAVTDTEVFRGLMGLYTQRDTLSWSRMQALGVIEIAALGGAFATRGPIAIWTIIIGSILVGFILVLIERDWQCRYHLREILDLVHKPRTIRLSPEPQWLTGKWVMRIIIFTLLAMNLIALLFVWAPMSPLQNRDAKTIQIRTPGQALLTYPMEPDKNINIEFDGTKVIFSATKP